MKNYLLALFAYLFFIPFSYADMGPCGRPVYCLKYSKTSEGVVLEAKSNPGFPIMLEVSSKNSQFSVTPSLPLSIDLKPDISTVVARFPGAKSADEVQNAIEIYHKWGWSNVNAPAQSLRMPFDTQNTYVITQGHNGKGSHQGTRQYAVDIGMPEGTPLLAMASGRVVKIEDEFNQTLVIANERGQANQLWVLHADGTIGVYMHMRYKGIKVQKFQMVSEGQHIADSGMTGRAKAPHVHLEIQRPIPFSDERQTLKFAFKKPSGGIVAEFVDGQSLP